LLKPQSFSGGAKQMMQSLVVLFCRPGAVKTFCGYKGFAQPWWLKGNQLKINCTPLHSPVTKSGKMEIFFLTDNCLLE
jgi:hypothetical protein